MHLEPTSQPDWQADEQTPPMQEFFDCSRRGRNYVKLTERAKIPKNEFTNLDWEILFRDFFVEKRQPTRRALTSEWWMIV